MRILQFLLVVVFLACNSNPNDDNDQWDENSIKTSLIQLINEREHAMIDKDISTIVSQFSEDVTWINSQGYYFEGKEVVKKFHNMLAENDSLDYFYEAGTPRIGVLDNQNALALHLNAAAAPAPPVNTAIPIPTAICTIGLLNAFFTAWVIWCHFLLIQL